MGDVVGFPLAEATIEDARHHFAELAALPRLSFDDLMTVDLDEIRRGGDLIVVDEVVAETFLRIGAIAEATGGLGCRWKVADALDAVEVLVRRLGDRR